MYIVDTWQEIESAHVEAGVPLLSDTIAELKEVAASSDAQGCQWAAFVGECRVCTYVEIMFVPFFDEDDLDDIICSNCGNETMTERELEEWQM